MANDVIPSRHKISVESYEKFKGNEHKQIPQMILNLYIILQFHKEIFKVSFETLQSGATKFVHFFPPEDHP